MTFFWDKYITKDEDLNKLISYSDDATLKSEMREQLIRIKNGHIIGTGMFFVTYSLLGILLVDAGYKHLHVYVPIELLVVYIFFSLITSFAQNYLIYYPASYISDGILYNWFGKISNLLNEQERKVLDEVISTIGSYYLVFQNILCETVRLSLVIIALLLSNSTALLRLSSLALVAIAVFFMIVSGKYWQRTRLAVYEKNKRLEILSKSLYRERLLFPTIYNSIVDIIPFVIALLLWFNKNSVVAQLGLFAMIVTYFFDLSTNIHKFSILKTALLKTNKTLETLTQTYILNHSGFSKLCALCLPSEELMVRSALDNSFVIKNFIPMAITNAKEFTHIYNFEFLPGIYQLNGVNGVGKTTFLESLTLPDKVRVEYSNGEVALQGGPFFDEALSIAEHRNKYIYIGTNASQIETLDFIPEVFVDYPNVKTFIENFQKETKKIQSEGEKAVLSICVAYHHLLTNGIKLIFIDEALSRIYNDETFPLRQDMLGILKEMTKKPNVIIIVVDHMTKLDFATQLHFTKRSIA